MNFIRRFFSRRITQLEMENNSLYAATKFWRKSAQDHMARVDRVKRAVERGDQWAITGKEYSDAIRQALK